MALDSRRNELASWAAIAMSERKRLAVLSFVTPAKVQRISYKNCKKLLSQALQGHGRFEDGLLLETTEKGVWYPIIHMAVIGFRNKVPENMLLNSDFLGSDFVLQQGLYEEIRHIESDELGEAFEFNKKNSLNESTTSEDFLPTFVILGYHIVTTCLQDVVEDTWKDWTAARYLYLNIPPKVGVGKIVLYRRLSPNDMSLFSYILLVECCNVTAQTQSCLMDFIHRFRAQRARGFLSVYQETCAGSSSSESASDWRSSTSCGYNSPDIPGRMMNDFATF